MSDIFELGFRIDTSPLQQAKNAAEGAAASVSKLGDAEQKLARDADKAAQGLKQANDAAKNSGTGAAAAAEQFGKLTGTISVSAQQIQMLAGALGGGMGGSGLAAAMGNVSGLASRAAAALGPVGLMAAGGAVAVGALGAAWYKLNQPLAEAADRYGLLEARLRNALGSQAAAIQSLNSLYETTQKTGLGFGAASDSFLRLARNGEALGATRDQILKLSETIQKLGAVSGASKGEIGSGMVQLSQALASGKLNGDELRSIMENMPALAKAIADGLGVSVGQIRSMGAAGELTGSKVFEAILKSSAKANEEFAKLPDTVEKANSRAADSWDQLLATLGQKWNSSAFVRSVPNFFADLVNKANAALQPENLGAQISALEARRATFAKLPGVNSEREVASIDARIKALRDQATREMSEVSKANADEEAKLARAFITKGAETGANEFDDYNKKAQALTANVAAVENALAGVRIRMQTGIATDADRALLPSLTRQAAVARAELSQMLTTLAKVQREASDATLARSIGGGGGGNAIVMQAIQMQRAAAKEGTGGSLNDFISAGLQRTLTEKGDSITSLERQTQAQIQLAAAVGGTREQMRSVEVATESANAKFEMFGKLGDGNAGVTAFMNKYTAALAASKKAADDFADSQARVNETLQISLAQAKLDTVGNGFAGRLAANTINANQTALRDPQLAEMQRRRFRIEEEAAARSQIFESDFNTTTNRQIIENGYNNNRFGRLGSQAEIRRIELNRRIERAQANVAPDQREALGNSMRAENQSGIERDMLAQENALNRQLKVIQDRQKLVFMTSEEFRVQNALLAKRNELEGDGASEEAIARQLRITEEIERQTIAYEKQRQRVESIFSIVDGAASDMKNVFVSSFEEMFTSGKMNADAFFNGISNMVRRAGAEMMYEIGVKPFVMAAANAAKAGLARFFSGPVSLGGGTAGGGGAPDPFSGPTLTAAFGAAFDAGGVRRFANGGIFSNSVVSNPTLFKYASGGALGLMGEAGPEAIMPLQRDASGRLGVSGGGGGVVVQVFDQRSSSGSNPVEVEEKSGPDGRKFISVLVRDEVRKAMRNGEMDRDMQTNFGSTRPVTRM
jgi:tape measure domain-containing protein